MSPTPDIRRLIGDSPKPKERTEYSPAEVERMANVLRQTQDRLAYCFLVMNLYASKEFMKLWQRTDPHAILGEVYMELAELPQMIADAGFPAPVVNVEPFETVDMTPPNLRGSYGEQ